MTAQNSETPLIPRATLFGNPERTHAQISPDGAHISYLAPRDGVLNVWVAPADDIDAAKPLTHDTGRGIREYCWAYTNRHVLYLQDADGDENWHVFCVDLETREVRDLSPLEGVQARIQEVSPKYPDQILLAINDRQPELHDLYRVNILTGDRSRILENPGFLGFETDDFDLKLAQAMTPDGGLQMLKPTEKGEWELLLAVPADDTLTTGPVGYDKSGENLFLIDSRDRNTAAVFKLDLASGQQTLLAEDERADVHAVEIPVAEKTIQAVSFNYDRLRWQVLDDAVADDFAQLEQFARGDFSIASRTLDDRQWIVAYDLDNGPRRYYHYDRESKEARFLFTNRSALEALELARMHPVQITTRDGMTLISYLTLPAGTAGDRPDQPVPLVLLVHGGPWARDEWGYDPEHQWLANRGYAVLSVNFRGSTGFGKAFINAANMEWGQKMHADLLDAVQWAIDEQIADPQRVAIYGGSYGGYAVLWGLTNSPQTFACGVDIVGPSSLITLLNSIPDYWQPMIEMFATRVGDHRTNDGKQLLEARSPLSYVDQITRPLLIGQGANDPRVKQAESDQIVKAMQAKDIPVTYVLYPDEGHGFARPENRLSFNAVAEQFLAEHLGGRCEPVGGDFENSSINVPAGAEALPGLADALPK